MAEMHARQWIFGAAAALFTGAGVVFPQAFSDLSPETTRFIFWTLMTGAVSCFLIGFTPKSWVHAVAKSETVTKLIGSPEDWRLVPTSAPTTTQKAHPAGNADREAMYAAQYGIAALRERQEREIFGHTAQEAFAARSATRMSAAEAKRHIRALEAMHEAIVPTVRKAVVDARLAVRNVGNWTQSDTAEALAGREHLFAAISGVTDAYGAIKRRIRELQGSYDLLGGAFPAITLSYPGAERLYEGTRKIMRGFANLSTPVPTGAELALLQPWIRAYLDDIEPFAAWADACHEAIKARRAEIMGQSR